MMNIASIDLVLRHKLCTILIKRVPVQYHSDLPCIHCAICVLHITQLFVTQSVRMEESAS